MPSLRRLLPLLLAPALLAPGAAHAAKPKPKPVPVPSAVRAFLLRADEPPATTFPRTPSLAWSRVAGTKRYEVQLATTSTFGESTRLWAGSVARTPAIALPLALPWVTGAPHAYYARVRAVTQAGTSTWSSALGFGVNRPVAPRQLATSTPGLVRWETVPGATSYQVWFLEFNKIVDSVTNAADEREYYSFHQGSPWSSSVPWRVRAVRTSAGVPARGLPAVSYGPWSETYTSVNPPFVMREAIKLRTTVSESLDAASETMPHAGTPAFLFSGTDSFLGFASELARVYVFSDSDCVDLVFRGAVVGSPAYAPRVSGPLALPRSLVEVKDARTKFLPDGDEGSTVMADGTVVSSSEDREASTGAPTPAPGEFALPTPAGALVDLRDSEDGARYHWTVVPVVPYVVDGTFLYRDLELPQDACRAGKVMSFVKTSRPGLAANNAGNTRSPHASGLSPRGRLVSASSAQPTFAGGSPLVAWEPALGAAGYEVQWGRTAEPWGTVGSLSTFATSAVLGAADKPLAPGRWFYRVRGLDPFVPGIAKQLSWSEPAALTVAKPTFTIVR